MYTLFQPAEAILLCSLWGFDNLAFNTTTSISSSKFNSVMSRTSSQSSLPVSCASSPVTIIDGKCLWFTPTAIGFAITSWFFEHPWTCYGCFGTCPHSTHFGLGPPLLSLHHGTLLCSPRRGLWFLRPSFGIQTTPVIPPHPPYLDTAVVTVSWSIDKALDSTLIL